MTPILEVNNVVKDFVRPLPLSGLLKMNFRDRPSTRALDGLSFSLNKGSVLGVLGPNGAGKTTLLKIIATLILPDKGTVAVNGLLPGRDDERIKAAVGLVASSETTFYWRLTGRQNLEFIAAMYGLNSRQTRARLDELFGLFGVDYQNRRYDSYSTGMKQKFAIMRSLIHDPELVLFDEPTKSLDYSSAQWLAGFIRDELVKKHGKTVVFTTHRMDEAAALADSFLILHHGRTLAFGKSEDLRGGSGSPGERLGHIYEEIMGRCTPC